MRIHANLAPTLLGAAALAFLALPAGPAVAQDGATGADEITYVESGQRKTRSGVTIQSADWDNVSYKNGGGRTANVPGANVVELRYGDAPREYAQGWRAVSARNGKAAKDAFEACQNAKAAGVIERDWIDEGIQVGLGEAYLLLALDDSGNYADAKKAFEAAVAVNAKSLMADRIHQGLAEVALGTNNNADAAKAADALVSAGRTARRPNWEIDGLFLRARVARTSGSDAAAGQAYQDAARVAAQQASNAKSPVEKAHFVKLEHRAAAAAGWLLLDKAVETRAAADFDKARTYFQGLPQKLGNEPDVLAAVENAMGVIKLSNDDAYGALRHFQTTEVMHFSVPSEVARSLYYQAQCWEKIGDAEMHAARLRDLKELYPKSEWARKL
jgi:tetratricopeptide (TPR) repeat protein